MAELYLLKTSEMEIDANKLSQFSKERQERIQHALKKEKAQHLYASELLLRYVLNRYGKKREDVQINAQGKPYLDDPFFFNISHSQSYLALVVSQEEVGVDLQAKTAISPQAAQVFLGEIYSNPSFVWCRKEAFLKCLGCGWADKKAIKQDIFQDEIRYEKHSYYFKDFSILDGYDLSVCMKNTFEDFLIQEVSKNELESYG